MYLKNDKKWSQNTIGNYRKWNEKTVEMVPKVVTVCMLYAKCWRKSDVAKTSFFLRKNKDFKGLRLEKWLQNRSKIHQKSFRSAFGGKTVTCNAQVGSGTLRGIRTHALFYFFRRKMSLRGSILGPLENRKSVQNRTFEWKPALGTSKNGLREGVRKKHEKSMKNGSKNEPKIM